jgi:anti-sigma factor RsiW
MKNCEDVSKGLIAYLDMRMDSAERRDIEAHLASCAVCRTRAEGFRGVRSMLEELSAVEPSFGFDARVRQRVAAEPPPSWFAWFAPQARLALSAAMLVALTVWIAKMPTSHPVTPSPMAANIASDQDFDAVKDLGVLENYDVVTKMDVLSQLVPTKAPETPQSVPNSTESND